ncbi:hypothetical protein CSPAE12_10281 [Colletotrichum incanum]|nr:hypothetical protein CSPAE12_10281 [Colletotrichum incanum]
MMRASFCVCAVSITVHITFHRFVWSFQTEHQICTFGEEARNVRNGEHGLEERKIPLIELDEYIKLIDSDASLAVPERAQWRSPLRHPLAD